MTKDALKLTLRTAATLVNVPLLLLGSYGMLSDRNAGEPFLQVLFAMLAVVAFLNLLVPWRWRASVERPFGIPYRLCRALGWAVNLLLFVVAVFAAIGMGDIRPLFLAVPCGLALLALLLTRSRGSAVKETPVGEYRHSPSDMHPDAAQRMPMPEKGSVGEPVWTENQPAPKKAAVPEANPLGAPDIATHYAMHGAEVDALQAEFAVLLVDKYGLRSDFVDETFSLHAADAPPAVQWHMDGKTAAQAADEFFGKLYYSPEANNPQIFGRHVETGEPLPPDYPYDSWIERNLGRTLGQKMAGGVALVFMWTAWQAAAGDFIVSREWFMPALALGIAVGMPGGFWLYRRWQRGYSRFKAEKGTAPWIVLISSFACAFCIYFGAGSVVHPFFADTERGNYAYRKDKYSRQGVNIGTKCLLVRMEPDVLRGRESRVCIKPSDYEQMDETGFIDLIISRSWFGLGVEKYALPFGAAADYSPARQD